MTRSISAAVLGRLSLPAAQALCALLVALAPNSAHASEQRAGPTISPVEVVRRDQEPGYRILLLYSESRLTPSVVSADQALRSTLEARAPRPIHFYSEFLDLNSFHGSGLTDELRRLLRLKYKDRPIDVIVAQGQLTVPFALQNRADLFSNAPVVFVGIERSTFAHLPSEPVVTGTWRHRAWADTLELARHLHPGTRRAVVIVGSSTGERFWLEAARRQLARHSASIEISYLVDSSFEEILKAVAALPRDSIVLVGPFLRDATGRDFATPALVTRLVAVAHVPIYGLTEGVIGAGVVGGHVVSYETHGKVAAELALRVLTGERPSPTADGTTIPMFDDQQVARWKIDRQLLPPGSVVLFHKPSQWEQYRWHVVGAASALLLQSGLIAVLLVQRAQRRRVRRTLAERLQFETLLSDLSAALASCSIEEIDREIENGLRRIVEDLDTDRASLWWLDEGGTGSRLIHTWTRAGVPPIAPADNESQFPWIYGQVRQGHVVRWPLPEGAFDEAPIDRQNLALVLTRSTALAPLFEEGVVMGALSVGTVREVRHWPDELVPRLRLLADIFANALGRQQAARDARDRAKDIRDLAGRLMTAQEEERRRIARELHDGVNQDLAALAIALSAIENGLPDNTPIHRRDEFARLQERAVDAAEAIRHLSHELHPGILQYTGLAAAVRNHCREFAREQSLPVSCRADDDLGVIAPDIALCLYRVTQEALSNVARHAKAHHVWVTAERIGSDLALTIRDDGNGFDLAEGRAQGGLGLISLEERVRLAGGRLAIDTKPGGGTEIHVVVQAP
jgi:signal transduction histidine kinase/ABC-type uncharacterized transport system substrate-binding protein